MTTYFNFMLNTLNFFRISIFRSKYFLPVTPNSEKSNINYINICMYNYVCVRVTLIPYLDTTSAIQRSLRRLVQELLKRTQEWTLKRRAAGTVPRNSMEIRNTENIVGCENACVCIMKRKRGEKEKESV